MFRKSKIEPVEKVKIVERYLAGEIGIRQAGKELGVDPHSIRNWISIYQYDGLQITLKRNASSATAERLFHF